MPEIALHTEQATIGPADRLLHLARRVRCAESVAELQFIAVNESRVLVAYRQAALWLSDGGVKALSGVVAPETNAPFVHWLQRVCRSLVAGPTPAPEQNRESAQQVGTPVIVTAELLEPQDAGEWEEWLPAHGVWLPLHTPGAPAAAGGLLLARDEPWQQAELQLLGEWSEIWWHDYHSRQQVAVRTGWRRWFGGGSSTAAAAVAEIAPDAPLRERGMAALRSIWRSRPQRYGLIVFLCLMIPVRLTVLAPGELVPAQPAAIRAPLEGTVDRFFVTPNQLVKAGQPLFQLDLAALNSRLSVALQQLATAEAEYRQSAQRAVYDASSKAQLASLQGRISQHTTEVDYLRLQLERAQVVAPRDGVVLVDDPSEWIGRPVAVGEKVLTIADEYDIEVEAWLMPADLIDMPADAIVTLYLNAAPLDPVTATLRYVAHEGIARPDGGFAYRLRATLTADQTRQRVGLKGTARISGNHVPLIYLIVRRPLALIRPYIGL